MCHIEITPKEKIKQALAVKDLSDPKNGTHAINLVVEKIQKYLTSKAGWPNPEIKRHSPVSSLVNEFDRLYFPKDSPSRSSVYTRYISETEVLRTHTSSMIPNWLIEAKNKRDEDSMVLCPGICYRRDVVDKKHTGEPHQMDIWRVKKGKPRLERPALIELIEAVIEAVIPGSKYRANEVVHPYTIHGLEVEIAVGNSWLEILECGEAHPQLLSDTGLDPAEYSGLAMGMGLDRMVMLIKKIDDIRLLRVTDVRIARQMENLNPYISVSKYPSIRQDMSVSVGRDLLMEDICEIIRDTMGDQMNIVEEIVLLSETLYEQLPSQAVKRLGIKPDQKNLLVRVVLRSHEKSLTHEEANEARNRIYRAIDQSETGGYIALGSK